MRKISYQVLVIPAKAGIQKNKAQEWIPAFAGMTVSPNCYKTF